MKFKDGDQVIPAKLSVNFTPEECMQKGYVYIVTDRYLDGFRSLVHVKTRKFTYFTDQELEHEFIKLTKAVKVLYGGRDA